MKKLKYLLLFSLLVSLVFSFAKADESQDVILLREGGKLRGKILSESPEKVVLTTQYHTTHTVYREDIQSIFRALGPEDQYRRLLKKLEANPNATGDEYFQLGLFCEKNSSIKGYAKGLFEKAIALDPNHPGARGKLGYILFEGKWVTLADLERARKKAEEEEREKIRKWEEWKKAQEELRKRQKTTETPKNTPEPPGQKKSGIYEKHLGMFRYDEQDRPWQQAYVYTSKYYRIKSNTKLEYIKVYAQVLDQFFDIFRKVFRYQSIPKRKSEIWIYANRKEFLDRTGKGTALGFYSLQTRRVTTYHGRWGKDTNTFTVLAHECTHQFQHLVLGTTSFWKTPIWVIEGLAVFLSTVDLEGKKVKIGGIPKDRLLPLQRMIRRNKYISIKELIRTPQRNFTGTHYAHAWGLIYWMVYTSSRNKKIFMRIWDKCSSGGMSVKEFEEIIKVDVDKWEAVWKGWILKLK